MLEPNQHHTDNWQITRQVSQPITPNYPLFHLLDSISGSDFTSKARNFAENEWYNTQAFVSFCELISNTFSLFADGLPLGIEPFPDEESLLSGQNMLSWSAITRYLSYLPRTIAGEAPTTIPDPEVTGNQLDHASPCCHSTPVSGLHWKQYRTTHLLWWRERRVREKHPDIRYRE
jgi:hypothetical protein